MKGVVHLVVVAVAAAGCADPSDGITLDPMPDAPDGGKADDPEPGFACTSPTFDIEVIADGKAGRYTTYRIGPDGGEHVLYLDEQNWQMVYASRGEGATQWHSMPVPCGGVVGSYFAGSGSDIGHTANQNLVVDADGNVFVACLNDVLELPAGTSTWQEHELVPVEYFDRWGVRYWQYASGSSIALGPDGAPHAVIHSTWGNGNWDNYINHQGRVLEHFTRGAAGWVKSPVSGASIGSVQGGMWGARAALCIDTSGPRIGAPFHDGTGYGINLTEVRRDGQTWASTLLHYEGVGLQGSGYHPACAFDSQDRALYVHFSYYMNRLLLVRKGAGDPIEWTIDPQTELPNLGGRFPDIATRGDRTFVSYQHDASLKLFTFEDSVTSGATYTVDVEGVGSHTSIAVDGSGRPRIAYYDAAEARLKLATGRCE